MAFGRFGATGDFPPGSRKKKDAEDLPPEAYEPAPKVSKDLRGGDAALPGVDGLSPAQFRNQPPPMAQEAGISPAEFRARQHSREPLIRPEDGLDENSSVAQITGAVNEILKEDNSEKSESAIEQRARLARTVTALQAELARQAGVDSERNAMVEAESAYLSAYEDFYRKNNALTRLGKTALNAKESKQLEALKNNYNATRASYGNKLTESALKRLGKAGYDKAKAEKITERYNRLIRFNEVVRPTAERKIQVRAEALGAKGQSLFEKGLSLLAKANQNLDARFGKNGARAIRAATSAVLLTAGPAAFGAFGTAGFLAVAGYGAFRFGRTLSASIIGAGVGESAGNLYERFRGRKKLEDAKIKLKTEGRAGAAAHFTDAELDALDANRAKFIKQADEKSLATKKNLIKAFTALGIGAGSSAVLAELQVIHDAAVAGLHLEPHAPTEPPSYVVTAPDAATSHSAEGASSTPALRGSIVDTQAPGTSSVPETSSAAPDAAPVPSETHIANASALHAEITAANEGSDQLWLDLKETLRQNGYSLSDANTPPAIRHILETRAHELSSEYGFASGSTSDIMHMGDSISVSDKGEVIFTPQGGETVVLAHTAADGSIEPSTVLHGGSHADHVPPAASSSEAPVTDHGSSDTAELNKWSLAHPGETPPPDLLHPHAATDSVPETPKATSGGATLQDWLSEPQKGGASIPQSPNPSEIHSAGSSYTTLQDFVSQGNEGAVVSSELLPADTPFPTINDFMHSSAWTEYHAADVSKIVSSDPVASGMSETLRELRSNLFDVVRDSGLGPNDGESLEKFIERASAHMTDPGATISHPAIVETPDHQFVARGGDFRARSLLTSEFMLRVNPDVSHVYVEGTNPESADFDFTRKALEGGEVKFASINPNLTDARVVF